MENPTFHLEGVVKNRDDVQDFEGPLSLILMLLSKNKIEIRDISISDILDQYLAYLDEMQRMDLEIASEFVQMAAYLLYIKTRTLLAAEEEVTELEQLMASLEQLKAKDAHEAVKTVLPALSELSAQGMLLWTRPQEPVAPAAKVYDYRHEGA
ncbi:MAG: segregation/condensation protein A [Oscillospiraceae bacterium]